MNKIINIRINGNSDNYKWNEFNCFYKAFAIALGAENNKYFDSFAMYVTAYVLYGIKGNGYLSFNSEDCILKYYKEELEDLFGSRIEKTNFYGYRSMCKKIQKALEENKVVICPCDLFYLPYYKSYKELHKRHYVIIKGIDVRKGIVYILDNMHLNLGASTKYEDFMITIKQLYEMVKSFNKNFDAVGEKTYVWDIEIKKNKNFDIDNRKYLLKLCNMIIENGSYLELDIINEIKKGNVYSQNNNYLWYANMRSVFWNTIRPYIRDKDKNILIEELVGKWSQIKFHITVLLERGSSTLGQVVEKLNEVIEIEKKLLIDIRDNLVIDSNVLDSNEISKYTIINSKNAKISQDDNRFDVYLDENEIYDIWNNYNDGVVILKKNFDDEIKGTIYMDTEFGSSSFAGIYIELENNKKILFGSLGRLNIAIHIPDEGKNYEPYISQKILSGIMDIKVKYRKDKCIFFVGNDEQPEFSLNIDKSIVKMGYFVKTWENCYCRVKIEDKS